LTASVCGVSVVGSWRRARLSGAGRRSRKEREGKKVVDRVGTF